MALRVPVPQGHIQRVDSKIAEDLSIVSYTAITMK
jgi:hypothetical protein